MDLRHTLSRAGLMILLTASLTTVAGAQTPDDADVKAAYLVKLGSFVEYPRVRNPKAFHVCVLGRDRFGDRLEREAAGQTIDGRPVVPRRLRTPADARQCDVLFVAATGGEEVSEALAAVQGESVLTVSDARQFIARGGMIQFVNQDGGVRFELNLESVQDAGLMASSELVRGARNRP